jgi:hypothetical protein
LSKIEGIVGDGCQLFGGYNDGAGLDVDIQRAYLTNDSPIRVGENDRDTPADALSD